MKTVFKAIIMLAVVIVISVLVINGVKNLWKPTFVEEDYEIKTITIQSGDTLSDYYFKYADTENCNQDEYLEAVRDLNNLRGSMIYAGDRIKVYKYVGDKNEILS